MVAWSAEMPGSRARPMMAALAVVLATGCARGPEAGREPSSLSGELAGTFVGTGNNTFVLRDGTWTLRSDYMRYAGDYRIDGDRLVLAIDRVRPLAFRQLCRGETDVYRWTLDGQAAAFVPVGETCSQNMKTVMLSADWIRTA